MEIAPVHVAVRGRARFKIPALRRDHGLKHTLEAGLGAWLDTFAEDFLNPLAADDRAAAKQEIIDLLEPILRDETGLWIADYVRLRFRATLVAEPRVVG